MSADEQPDAPAPSPAEGDFERGIEALKDALRRTDDAQDEWSAREDLAGAGFESSVWAGAYAGDAQDEWSAREDLAGAGFESSVWAAVYDCAGAGERQGSGSQGADLEADGLSPERGARAMWRDLSEPVRLARAMFQARFETPGEPINEASAGRLVAELVAAQREGLVGPETSLATSLERATSSAVDAELHARRLDALVARAVAGTAPVPKRVLEQWLAERDAVTRRKRGNVERDVCIWVALICLEACGLRAQVSPARDALSGVAVVAGVLGMTSEAVAKVWTRAKCKEWFVLSERHGPATRKGTSKT